jgi:hypothetical protein
MREYREGKTMKCPRCKLINPDTAVRCDCGYDFAGATMNQSYIQAGSQNYPPDEKRWTTASVIKLLAWFILLVETGLYSLTGC